MFKQDFERRLRRQITGECQSPLSGKHTLCLSPASPGLDRFVPVRINNNWKTNFASIPRTADSQPSCKKQRGDGATATAVPTADGVAAAGGQPTAPNQAGGVTGQAGSAAAGGGSSAPREALAYGCLLRNELLGARVQELRPPTDGRTVTAPITPTQPVFKFKSPSKQENLDPAAYSLSPISAKSQKLLRSPRKATRKISRIPFKVLDAPELQDDFYLNLVDWSAQNVLSVGLGSCVYLWSACTSQVTRLCDLSSDGNAVTSVSWSERGSYVAVGTQKGYISVWDVAKNTEITRLIGHNARVGALAWNGDILSSGSRDRHIRQRDTRTPSLVGERTLVGHRQEVCGLKWSPDGQCLASGGNDNKLFVWSQHSVSPVQTYGAHLAAVKAIAWSPHQHGLLASGGGTADRCIRFWNTLTGQPMQCVDTGSQVCNLAWSKHSSELVSTHGYSQNQILVWKYPSLTQVAKLTGHSYRVLYLALSPDGEAIVTGAGDETLRFWNVFSKTTSHRENKSLLTLYTSVR